MPQALTEDVLDAIESPHTHYAASFPRQILCRAVNEDGQDVEICDYAFF